MPAAFEADSIDPLPVRLKEYSLVPLPVRLGEGSLVPRLLPLWGITGPTAPSLVSEFRFIPLAPRARRETLPAL